MIWWYLIPSQIDSHSTAINTCQWSQGQSNVVFIKGSSVTRLVSARTKQIVLFPVNIIYYDIPRRYIKVYLDYRYNLDTKEGMLDRYVYGRYCERCLVSSCVVYRRAPITVVIMYPVFTDHGRLHCHYLLCLVVWSDIY